MRLRTQFGLSLGALGLLIGIFMIGYFPSAREATALKSLQEEAVHTSAIIARAALLEFYRSGPGGGYAELQSVQQIAKEDSDLVYLQFFDQDAKELLSHYGDLAGAATFSIRSQIQTALDASMLHVVMPVRLLESDAPGGPTAVDAKNRGEFLGSIQIGYSLHRMHQEVRHDQKVTITIAIVIVLCAALIAFLLSDFLMRPLEAFRQVVFAYGQGNENVRAKIEGPHEISRLGAAFNHMADALKKSSQAERKKAAELVQAVNARAEVEQRFRRAFENSPIGMGLLNADGSLFDANPALEELLWPTASKSPQICFSAALVDEDRERFEALFGKLASSERDGFGEKFTCCDAKGQTLQTVANLSAVRSDNGDFLYAVLQLQDITESLKLTDQLQYQASYDDLTGLLNRRSFELELNRAWDQAGGGKGLSYLMFMDLDQFKVVNDTSGHAAGDQLLQRVGEILLDKVRSNDTVCRLGGDEFGVILWNCPADVAKNLAESIRAAIENCRFQWEMETYRIGVSIGGLAIDPAVGDTVELQQLADAACYAAKEEGRNRVHLVAGKKDSARVHRGQVRWVQRLREAMDHNRFAIYGQVIKPLAADADEPEHLEILLRLRDRGTRKLIPPGAFLPAAERYGLSIELDQWVVRSLLDRLFIHDAFTATRRQYWINLSGTSIGDHRFAEFLKDAIRKSPLTPGTINFEITETAIIRSIGEATKLIESLNEMGCKFSLDDFGSGLSSYGYLKKLPVDYLKIDGMFIRDILADKTNRIFVKSIIDIAHALNIKTVAEFVENDEILEVVRDLGADYAQGFAINRPFELAPQFPLFGDSDLLHTHGQKQAG